MSGNTPAIVGPRKRTTKTAVAVESEPAPTEAAPMKILRRKEILESDDLAHEIVSVPEWGGAVIVRAMTGVERDAYEGEIFSLRGTGGTPEYNLQNIRAKLAARTIINEDGIREFSDSDIANLGLKSAAALERVFTVAQKLSRLGAEDVKQLAAQLGNGQSASSGSA